MNGSPGQSLTVLTEVTDSAACAQALEENAAALEAGWARVAEIRTACFALLPPITGAPTALFFECTFEGDLTSLGDAIWSELGAELATVFRYCEGQPQIDAATSLIEFLRARARRSTALGAPSFLAPLAPRAEPAYQTVARRGALALAAAWSVWFAKQAPASAIEPNALEARLAAVGWQEPVSGVPLVHVAELLPLARARLKRALRGIAGAAPRDRSFARFLLGPGRLVFLAYPRERAALFSERLSRDLAVPLAGIWAQTRGAPRVGLLVRRRRRARRIERFLLGSRVPVAVWFNAG